MAKRFIDGQEVAAVGDFYTEKFENSSVGDLRTITVSKPGTYALFFEVSFVGASNNVSRSCNVDILINETLIRRAYDQVANTSTANDYGSASCMHIATLEVGDVILFRAGQNAGGGTTVQEAGISVIPIPVNSSAVGSIGTIS
jgi:hypothetical protein